MAKLKQKESVTSMKLYLRRVIADVQRVQADNLQREKYSQDIAEMLEMEYTNLIKNALIEVGPSLLQRTAKASNLYNKLERIQQTQIREREGIAAQFLDLNNRQERLQFFLSLVEEDENPEVQ